MQYIAENDLKKRIRIALRKLIKEEDIKNYKHIDYGIYDQPHLSGEEDELRDDQEGKESKEIMPSPEASMQMSVNVPDVGNPEYVPQSVKELQRAAFTVAEKVPDSQLTIFYRGIIDLLEKAIDQDTAELQNIKEVSDLPHSYRKQKPTPGNYSLQQTADEIGITSVANMAKFEISLLKKMKALLMTSKTHEIDSLLDASLDAYKNVMMKAGNMSQEDLDVIQSDPDGDSKLKSSNLFKAFVGNAVLGQAMRKIRLDAEKALMSEIEKLDIPQGADLTIKNHVLGNTNMSYQKFIDLIGKKAEKTNFDMDKVFDLSKKMPSILQKLRGMIDDLGNTKLIPFALKLWMDSSDAKKEKLLMKAIQELQSTYDAVGAN